MPQGTAEEDQGPHRWSGRASHWKRPCVSSPPGLCPGTGTVASPLSALQFRHWPAHPRLAVLRCGLTLVDRREFQVEK